jgi:hypothetical protein
MCKTMLKEEIFFDIQLLRREINHEVVFIAIIMFASLHAVGEDYEAAVVP